MKTLYLVFYHDNALYTPYISLVPNQYFSFSTELTETNGALIGVSRNSLQGKSYFGSTSQLFSLSADCW